MNFNTIAYLLFLISVVGLYYVIPHKLRWILLLCASYYFYMSWNQDLVFLIMAITLVTYVSGLIIEKTKNSQVKKALLGLSVLVSLGLLLYFKYFNFIVSSFNSVFQALGQKAVFSVLDMVLPVGISFYTFQGISYVIDIYRQEMKAHKHLGYYALYIAFFPQLVAGPIERTQNLLPQFQAEHTLNKDNIKAGIDLLLSGYFRKVVIADTLGPYVNQVFVGNHPENGLVIALGLVLFSIQIYCDFSGYSEIAAGSARLIGIKLMRNFDQPYGATSIRDFWQRWHISLSTWFRDYIYVPLGGNRRGKLRHLIALMAVFLLSGIWHGASWHFVAWGAIHCLYYLLEMVLEKQGVLPKIPSLGRLYTFLLVSFSWVFFRANDMKQALDLIGGLGTRWRVMEALEWLNIGGWDLAHMVLVIACLPILNRLVKAPYGGIGLNARDLSGDLLRIQVVLVIAFSYLMSLEFSGNNVFIYFQF